MALPVAAIICIVLACWVLVVLILFAVYQLLKSRGTCNCECAPCGKEESGGCCKCCISLSDSCNCCNPSVNGCLDKICPGKKKVSCVDLLLCQCCAGEGEESCCLKIQQACDRNNCDDCETPPCPWISSVTSSCTVPCFKTSSTSSSCSSCACPRWVCKCHSSQCSHCLDCLCYLLCPKCETKMAACCHGNSEKCCEHYVCCCCECNLKENQPEDAIQPMSAADGIENNLAHLTESLAKMGCSLKVVSSDGTEYSFNPAVASIESLNELKEIAPRRSLQAHHQRPLPPLKRTYSSPARSLPVKQSDT